MRNQRRIPGLAAASIALATMLLAATLPALAAGEIAGQVGDKKFSIADVDAKAKAANAQVYQALYDARRQALDTLIEDYLLEKEAAAQNMTVEQLVAKEIDSKIAAVTQEDVQAWYNENKSRVGGRSLESIQSQIQQYLTMQRTSDARSSYIKTLKDKTAVKIALQPPRVDIVIADNDPYKGPKDAPVTIVEYSDFQ